MFLFLCSFMYYVDDIDIPDQIGYMCVIHSDCNLLEDFPISTIEEYYVIQELLEQNSCDTIILEEITDDKDKIEFYSNKEQIQINKNYI